MNATPPSTTSRVSRLFLGLTLCGLGIAVMDASGLGLGPWDVLHKGLSAITGIPLGSMGIVVGLLVLVLWLPLRVRPGIGTVANVIWIGVVIDLTLLVLPVPTNLAVRVLGTVAGVLLFGVGSGYYIGAGMGPGPRDGLMTGIAARGPSIAVVRTGIELTVLALGILLGGTIGLGTVLFALGVGPVVGWSLPRLTMPPTAATLRRQAAAAAVSSGTPASGRD